MRPYQLSLFAEATLALRAPALEGIDHRAIPTCPAISLPWSEDFAHDGWSARMFLHQTLCASRSGWTCSDTESLLSRSTLVISPVRAASVTTCAAALMPEPPPLSSSLFLSTASIVGLARRATKRKRPLQRVLLRTATGWRRKTLFCSSLGSGYEFYLPKRRKPCKDCPEAGLLDFLNAAVAQ